MSGDDGRGHGTNTHNTSGSINGGPTGLGIGGGTSDGSGWSSEDSPWSGGSGSGVHWGGGSGHSNGGGSGSSGGGSGTGGNLSTVATSAAFGFPALSTPGAGDLAVNISAGALSVAITNVMAALEEPSKSGLWRVALYGVLSPQIAKDDPNMISKIVTSLPADDITESPVSLSPLSKATVNVDVRVINDIKDERQNISVISGVPMSVPVVGAKPTERPGVFAASVSGAPVLNISVNDSTPAVQTLSPGVTSNTDKDVRPTGFTQGGNTRDAVTRFPKSSDHNAVYVSVNDVLDPDQVR